MVHVVASHQADVKELEGNETDCCDASRGFCLGQEISLANNSGGSSLCSLFKKGRRGRPQTADKQSTWQCLLTAFTPLSLTTDRL